MNFREAAIKALKIVDNEAKTARELWQIIDYHDLKSSDGETLWASLNTDLVKYSDSKYDSQKGKGFDEIFERIGGRPNKSQGITGSLNREIKQRRFMTTRKSVSRRWPDTLAVCHVYDGRTKRRFRRRNLPS